MIKLVQADEETLIRNINVAPDVSGPYNKIINWLAKGADGYIILFTNAAEENAVNDYFSGLNLNETDPKKLMTNNDIIKVRVLSQAEFKSSGGKFIYKEASLIPTRVTVYQYRLTDGDIVVYRGDGSGSSCVIPILINYTITYKKSLMLVGAKKAVIKILNSNCMPGALFYKISGISAKFPITETMMKNQFTVNVGNNNITVFSAGKYAPYYNVKQKRI
ncbi:MAG: hypothetical protein IJH94_01475 [Clostridia bacterium]|nr:hypothetical protein [Clostridia bacterium]